MSERSTQSRIPVKPHYTPGDLPGFDYATQLNEPGAYPYTRGARPRPAGRGGWIQRELSGEGDPSRSNAQFQYLLAQGQTGLDVIGDAPTMGGLDPDHPFAAHAVGTQGVSLCCLEDYRQLYRDLPLDRITLSHSLPAAFAVAALHTVARERGFDPATLRGSVIQAPYYCEDCSYAIHMPFKLRVRLAADVIAFCSAAMPKFHAFLEDTYFISESGLDSVEEMALGFVEIRGLVRELLARGVDVDRFAPRIAILLNCRMDFFEEIAKIRATRRLFARMMREEFGAKDPRSWAVNIAAHTSGLSLTAQQPVNNIVRGAIQALALGCAGVQAIEVSTFDEAFRTPSPEAHVVGLRTQQVIDRESNVTMVADPLGGSYYVEALTDELERRIWEMVQSIEAKGDPAALSDSGWFRTVFQAAMERHARALADGTLEKVGVNAFQVPDAEDVLLRDVAERKIEPCRERVAWMAAYRAQRDASHVQAGLQALDTCARDWHANLLPAIVAATEAGATMGEMAGVLRRAYGHPADPFRRLGDPL
ncbi:MAG TPA: methylmalonyl-CoA mutase family protein [Candidatus Acidoferrales bacterium]|nr:methylmalonyl-CoA mutase family protein [Candidatus Acidoferrales bacterium]